MNNTILFYNKKTGYGLTGTLAGGRWEPDGFGGSVLALPVGYTHGAASRDTLVLYNFDTGAGESGTFTDGRYSRVEFIFGEPGWPFVKATADSVLFYNHWERVGASGTLKNGVHREMRRYNNFSRWHYIAASSDTVVFIRPPTETQAMVTAYGILKDGIYTHVGSRLDAGLGPILTATKDSVVSVGGGAFGEFGVTTALGGSVGAFRLIGNSVDRWDMVGRTADSLFFYRTDGTSWGSTLVGGNYANVGPISNVMPSIPGWTIIAGGV